MKNRFVILAFCACLGFSCNRPAFHQVEVDNPPFRKNIVFKSFEDLSSPKFRALREKYQLDTVFHGEKDEFKRVLLLRDWIRTVIEIDNSGKNYPGEGQAEGILDAALQGHGFHCGHYMIVQNAVMNAYGYVTRCIGAGEGADDGLEIHHGLNEVWINSFGKWVLSDAKYNYHFEKNGIPLSALEVRDAYLKNKAADIMVMKGPDRMPTPFDKDQQNRSTELYARIYTFLEWEMYNNRYTKWPDVESYLVMLNDEYFKNHIWIWNGKPHWAYGKEYMNLIEDRGLIEWTPNTLSSRVEIAGDHANIKLATTTPNFKTCQMRRPPDTTWENVADSVRVDLENGRNELEFRTVNLANVSGPPHKVTIEN